MRRSTSYVVALLLAMTTACSPNGKDKTRHDEIDTVQQLTTPQSAQDICRVAPTLAGNVLNAAWAFDVSMGEEEYWRWCATNLEGPYTRRRVTKDSREYSRYSDGDAQYLTITSKHRTHLLHITVAYWAHPD